MDTEEDEEHQDGGERKSVEKRKGRKKLVPKEAANRCYPWEVRKNHNPSLSVIDTPLCGAWKYKCSCTDRSDIFKSAKQSSPSAWPSWSTQCIIDKAGFYQDILACCVVNVYHLLFITHYLIKIIVLISLLKWLIRQVLKEINIQRKSNCSLNRSPIVVNLESL